MTTTIKKFHFEAREDFPWINKLKVPCGSHFRAAKGHEDGSFDIWIELDESNDPAYGVLYMFEDDGPIADQLHLLHLHSFLEHEKARHLFAAINITDLGYLLHAAFGKPVTPPQPETKDSPKESDDVPPAP